MGKDQREKTAEAHSFLLKLAIPLALSLAGFAISTLTRKTGNTQIQEEEEEQMDYSESFSRYEFEEEETSASLQHLEDTNEIAISQSREEATLKEEMEDLKSLVACLEEREGELESQFYEYCNMKDQESALQKIQIMCLGLKLESLEYQNQKLEGIMTEIKEAVKKFETIEDEIKMLNTHSNDIQEQAHTKEEMLKSNEELKLANKEFEEVADQMSKEKEEMEEKYSAAMSEQRSMTDNISRLHNKKLFDQLQQLQGQWSAEMEKLLYLGWINASLRRELIFEAEENNDKEEREIPVREIGDKVVVVETAANKQVRKYDIGLHDPDCPSLVDSREKSICFSSKNHHKPRLIHKIKGWAKGKQRCQRALKENHSEFGLLKIV